ncbi:uncharacterized protein PGTG_08483 [Puccinia graminis f. sp. tritici CRL 75-36-700-3]|uniref:Uncharacterized protein n=1 Tax=Puccinia graminis f. sp. tritici (strain CRL 75-36-700-3 / race SCCL) TaxID=418459 RepID=E3KDV4_PUCGT|nr:uncharacterized protein PGTG_08483 [Puccinia graminis f. sp. tritici CRL 75-36-700-3]EFP82527.2 hypothetical protein PGTG_08483 [Puccinia graminis f. sp. tritici CRL 75-36-700-3]
MNDAIQNESVTDSTSTQTAAEPKKSPSPHPPSTPPPDPDSYRMSFPSDNLEKPPRSPDTEMLPAPPEICSGKPLLESEIQEIGEEEFLRKVTKVQDFAKACYQLRIPKSIKQDVEGIVTRLDSLRKGYEESKTLPTHECLMVKPSSQPTITRPSSSAPPKPNSRTKKKSHTPVAITSHISTLPPQPHESNGASEEQSHLPDEHPINKGTPDRPETSATITKKTTPVTLNAPNCAAEKIGDQSLPEDSHDPSKSPTTFNSHKLIAPTRILNRGRSNPVEESGPSTNGDDEDAPTHPRSHIASSLTPLPEDDKAEDQPTVPNQDDPINPPDSTANNSPSHDHEAEPSNNDQPSTINTAPADSIINLDSLRTCIYQMATEFRKGRVTKTKWEQGWDAAQYLMHFRLDTPHVTKIPTATFVYNQAQFNCENWIKEIVESATEILAPSSHEPWFIEDLINFTLIKKQIASEGTTIVSASQSPHPEFNFFRAVRSLIKLPPPRILREWAKTVALSVQTISDENPKAPEIQSAPSSLRRHVIVLTWLNTLKNTMPILPQITDGQPEDGKVTNSLTTAPSTSTGDALDDLRKTIIDMIMSYTIIQAHSEDQHNPRKKPKTKSNSTTVATKDAPDRKSLSEIESRHNYFPLISFLLSGVRGIFISTRDYRQYSISHCLKVLSIFKRIISSSQGPSSAHEAVWVNLGSYIHQILDSLAKCIAHDYINVTSKESELFNIPQNATYQ